MTRRVFSLHAVERRATARTERALLLAIHAAAIAHDWLRTRLTRRTR